MAFKEQKGANFFVHLWRISLDDFARAPRNHDGIFTSGVSTANQITTLVGQNLADRPKFLRDFWSGPILASDDIREHMGEAKNGPDRRLSGEQKTSKLDQLPAVPGRWSSRYSH